MIDFDRCVTYVPHTWTGISYYIATYRQSFNKHCQLLLQLSVLLALWKFTKESFLKSCRWHNAGKKVDESRYDLDSFVFPEITTKTMAHDEKQAVTSSVSSSFLVSPLDFVSSFLSVAASFSFFCSATGAMLESMKFEACTDSSDLVINSCPNGETL